MFNSKSTMLFGITFLKIRRPDLKWFRMRVSNRVHFLKFVESNSTKSSFKLIKSKPSDIAEGIIIAPICPYFSVHSWFLQPGFVFFLFFSFLHILFIYSDQMSRPLLRTSTKALRASAARISSRAAPLLTRQAAVRSFTTTRWVYSSRENRKTFKSFAILKLSLIHYSPKPFGALRAFVIPQAQKEARGYSSKSK